MQQPHQHIDTYISQADNLRFKLLAIAGKEDNKKQSLTHYLEAEGWTIVDVGKELMEIEGLLKEGEKTEHDIGHRIKKWFNGKPDKLILTNASILYHDSFRKISPIGAFKYNSRSKQCIIFLEDEQLVSNRLYYGNVGGEDYKDQDIYDIVYTKLEDIKEEYTPLHNKRKPIDENAQLSSNAIGRLFNYTKIKDVVDIDSDLEKTDLQKELISSYIISEHLERQIVDFFENLDNPQHKATKIVGNYGSGKSHLIAFLITAIAKPDYINLIQNRAVRNAANQMSRNYNIVQFELMSGDADLSIWFYQQIKKQLKRKYNIEIQLSEDIDHKDKIKDILSQVKTVEPTAALMVVMDEVSDFLQQKEMHLIRRDLQFLRVVAQLCQSEDLMVVTSMQEDIFTNQKFKEIGAQESRISERFQNITIHKEDVSKVIAQRIVPKNNEQRNVLTAKFQPYADKIEDIRHNLNNYIDLFPLTPFLLDLFHKLPYFEKRGAIQFAQKELRYVLNEDFPYFFTFDNIYDILNENPNLRNLEEIYDLGKVVDFVLERIKTSIEDKYQADAFKIIKGLAVYRLWSDGENGATAQDLAEKLVLISDKKLFEATDYVLRIVKLIRDATDGFYLKVVNDEKTGIRYFNLDPKIQGGNPDEKIEKEITTVGNTDIEEEIFTQLKDILELVSYQNSPDVFTDECRWESVKSFRTGSIIFCREHTQLARFGDFDYTVVLISPYRKKKVPNLSDNQINLKINIGKETNIEHLKRIVAIRKLLGKNIMTSFMSRKLLKEINGTKETGTYEPGIKYKIARWANYLFECKLNSDAINIRSVVGKEINNFAEVLKTLKQKLLDNAFNKRFPEHPKYSMQFTSDNIVTTLSDTARRVASGNFQRLQHRDRDFLHSIHLLDIQGYPDINSSNIALNLFSIIRKNNTKVTDIERDLVEQYLKPPYGMEAEVVHFLLIVMTTLGKITLKARGGDTIDISNIDEKFRSFNQFATIAYALPKDDSEYHYDFASRLLNALGINGSKILNEKTRSDAFREYKERVQQIQRNLQSTETLVEKIGRRQTHYLDKEAMRKTYDALQFIDWEQLNIKGFTKFKNLLTLSESLPDLSKALKKREQLHKALEQYDDIHEQGLEYMKEAVAIAEANPQYLKSPQQLQRLQEYYNDTLQIVQNFKRYLKEDERHPINGKISSFKNQYIQRFYIPAYENTIGNEVSWEKIQRIESHDVHHRLQQLTRFNCVSVSKFNRTVQQWRNLLSLRGRPLNVDRLQSIPFDTHSNFMRNSEDYSKIKETINRIDATLQQLKQEYETKIVHEIIQSKDNLKHAKISKNHKATIERIITSQQLPPLDDSLIRAINQLFKDYAIVSLSSAEVLQTLFERDELLTVRQFNEAMQNLHNLVKSKAKGDAEIRIKLDS